MTSFGSELLAAACGDNTAGSIASLRHVAEIPARSAEVRDWPSWAGPDLLAALRSRGITAAW